MHFTRGCNTDAGKIYDQHQREKRNGPSSVDDIVTAAG
jgi:hypothetical protein